MRAAGAQRASGWCNGSSCLRGTRDVPGGVLKVPEMPTRFILTTILRGKVFFFWVTILRIEKL